MAALPKECILTVGNTRLLMPVDQAMQVFQLLHGSTAISEKYDAAYKNVGWKIEKDATLTLAHADPTLRAKLALGEEEG